MNNNSIRIDSYLQNEMSAEEKAAFEAALLTDPELLHEMEVQRSITQAAYNAGLKLSFAKAIRKRVMTTRLIRWGIIVLIGAGAVLLYTFMQSVFHSTTAGNQNIAQQNNSVPFINPPLKSIDVPFDEYDVNADTGDTLFMPSGSVVFFPPSAFVDESGNLIRGEVKIRFREFTQPIDFFVSGITMAYDSAGTRYNFESSGMCEINAYQNSKALFVNPGAKPEISLSATNKSTLHNLYYLDTIKRSWTFMGKDIITEVKNPAKTTASPASLISTTAGDYPEQDKSIPVKPLKPMKASDDHQSFSIAVEPDSFDELLTYDKVKFEVIDESTYKRSDADEHWDNVVLSRGEANGTYFVTFSNAQRKVSYKVRPVLEGEDYAAALKVFNEKNKAYEQTMKNRLAREKSEADNNKKQMDAYNAQIKRMQDAAAEANKRVQDYRLKEEIRRTFAITGFGVWNCDNPVFNNSIPIAAIYTDSLNNPLTLDYVSVVYKDFNGISDYIAGNIRVFPGRENMIWAVKDSVLCYFNYKDFTDAGIQRGTTAFTFKMRQKRVSSYAEMKQEGGK
jgi:hypothetical protein